MRGLDNLTTDASSLNTTTQSAAVLTAMCVVLAAVALARFHYRDVKLADL